MMALHDCVDCGEGNHARQYDYGPKKDVTPHKKRFEAETTDKL
jgi:hypothetical protein